MCCMVPVLTKSSCGAWPLDFLQCGNCLLLCLLLGPFQQGCDTAAVSAESQPTAGAAARHQHSRYGLRIQAKMQVVNTLKNHTVIVSDNWSLLFCRKSVREMVVCA